MTRVDDARQVLGVRLRDLRVSARMTGRGLAAAAGWHPAKVSKIEHGKQLPSEEDLAIWCRLTDNKLALPDLAAALRNVDAAYMEWRRIAATGRAHRQRQSIKLEGAASLVRGFDCLIPPGLLQTRHYAEAVLSRCIRFLDAPDDLDAALAARMERQQVLRAPGHRFHFVVAESALYTSVGSEEIRRAQMEHLLSSMHLPRLRIGVLPDTAEFFYETTNFLLYDDKIAQVETISAELTIRQPRELALYERAFEMLTEQAVYGNTARELVMIAINGKDR
ncbi:helix-turn-helix domain-containing protein [Nocardia wallacei]|uniref:Transcriptional regulator n=1 Tax=Nocardia wallacei TaxID=480035 RepID=A0A7G1KMW5_9NOCA|nr:helix-turn-helix transcriptional regulator [Nocardia wallacei]BCK56181.1 transcriptional regulator [Nocardia wallacei]